jgi:imidazolonepropionase-like amidohydrolase
MFQIAYFVCSLLSASFLALSSASTAFTFTSGSTPIPSQSALPKGLIVVAGLTPMQALETATTNPAQLLSLKDHWGQLAPGFT